MRVRASTPLHIESALQHQFSENFDVAYLQRLALAHIGAERELEQLVQAGESPLSRQFLKAAHRALYSRLAPEDRVTNLGHIVGPGEARTVEVEVGTRFPPTHSFLPKFLKQLEQAYDQKREWDTCLFYLACLHPYSAWAHLFMDGNGRAVRLQSECALWALSEGLWSLIRR